MPTRSRRHRSSGEQQEAANRQSRLPWHTPEAAGKFVEILVGTDLGVPCEVKADGAFVRWRADFDRVASPAIQQASQSLRTAVCQLEALQGDEVEFGTELIYQKAAKTVTRHWYLRLPGRCKEMVATPGFQAHVRVFAKAIGDLDAAGPEPASEAGGNRDAMLVLAKALQSSLTGARHFPENTMIRCAAWAEPITLPKTVANAPKVVETEKDGEMLVRVTGSNWGAREVHVLPENRTVYVPMNYDQAIFERVVEEARLQRRNQYRIKFKIEFKGGKPHRYVLKSLELHMEDFFPDYLDEALEESMNEV